MASISAKSKIGYLEAIAINYEIAGLIEHYAAMKSVEYLSLL
jgi:hypothetical protein